MKKAADTVQTQSAATAKSTQDPKQAAKKLGGTFGTFADRTSAALDDLKKADVPDEYKGFHDKTVTAYAQVVDKLRDVAKATRSGSLSALSDLGTELNAVKLPDLPKDIADHAKSCAAIT